MQDSCVHQVSLPDVTPARILIFHSGNAQLLDEDGGRLHEYLPKGVIPLEARSRHTHPENPICPGK